MRWNPFGVFKLKHAHNLQSFLTLSFSKITKVPGRARVHTVANKMISDLAFAERFQVEDFGVLAESQASLGAQSRRLLQSNSTAMAGVVLF